MDSGREYFLHRICKIIKLKASGQKQTKFCNTHSTCSMSMMDLFTHEEEGSQYFHRLRWLWISKWFLQLEVNEDGIFQHAVRLPAMFLTWFRCFYLFGWPWFCSSVRFGQLCDGLSLCSERTLLSYHLYICSHIFSPPQIVFGESQSKKSYYNKLYILASWALMFDVPQGRVCAEFWCCRLSQ